MDLHTQIEDLAYRAIVRLVQDDIPRRILGQCGTDRYWATWIDLVALVDRRPPIAVIKTMISQTNKESDERNQ